MGFGGSQKPPGSPESGSGTSKSAKIMKQKGISGLRLTLFGTFGHFLGSWGGSGALFEHFLGSD